MQSLNVVRKNLAVDLVGKVDSALNAAVMSNDIDSNTGFYAIEGMSGKKYRHFINNLVRSVSQPRYLEIGSWAGSTLCSAIHGNAVDAIAIDNWSEFGGPKDVFLYHLNQFRTPQAEVRFIESDFRCVDYRQLGSRNIYLFDGPHEEQDQYDGLNLALPCLDRQFVFIVDDWNWLRVRSGTFAAIKNCGLNILFSAEIRTTLNNQNPEIWMKHSDWHNGYFIAVLEQSAPG
jgi:hypothetical protein